MADGPRFVIVTSSPKPSNGRAVTLRELATDKLLTLHLVAPHTTDDDAYAQAAVHLDTGNIGRRDRARG